MRLPHRSLDGQLGLRQAHRGRETVCARDCPALLEAWVVGAGE
jgi:hypothetical protein